MKKKRTKFNNLVLTSQQRYMLGKLEKGEALPYEKQQSTYHFWRKIWQRTNFALDELILAAHHMPNEYMRRAFDYGKLEVLLQKIATKPQISKRKRKKEEKPEYVKDEALFHFCMSVVRDLNIQARNLVKADILDISGRKTPLFISPEQQAILTTIFYTISHLNEAKKGARL